MRTVDDGQRSTHPPARAADPRFPFGAPATRREARLPVGSTRALVLGVYPSALHVRWTLPRSRPDGLAPVVGALAVDDEPTVFWDGSGQDDLVDRWCHKVGFRPGDGPSDHGHVTAAGNGTSGRSVSERVLAPLGIDPDDVWYTDAIDRFFIKSGGRRNQQGDVIRNTYDRFAATRHGLDPANLPPRPTPAELVHLATTDHRDRLRADIVNATPPLVITLGEEARQVLAGIADHTSGPPTTPLTHGDAIETDYGHTGDILIAGVTSRWCALVHPGNRSDYWTRLHARWITTASASH